MNDKSLDECPLNAISMLAAKQFWLSGQNGSSLSKAKG